MAGDGAGDLDCGGGTREGGGAHDDLGGVAAAGGDEGGNGGRWQWWLGFRMMCEVDSDGGTDGGGMREGGIIGCGRGKLSV